MDYRKDQVRSVQGNGAARGVKAFVAKKPFVAKGHDATLKQFQDSGALFTIHLLDGDFVTGKLIARDKFTLTVHPTDSKTPETFFKHAIKSFHEGE